MSRNTKTNKRYTGESSGATSTATASPIWTIRPVEWPFQLPSSVFAKCLKSCRIQGQSLGIPLIVSQPETSEQQQSQTANEASTTSTSNANNENSYFSGLMSRVLLTQPTSADTAEWVEAEQTLERQSDGAVQSLRSPRCVAAANGWIIGVSEIPIAAAVLRLISKWNVRRTVKDPIWVALPPPVVIPNTTLPRIQHVFCDPTANHIVVSASNGEAYYYTSSHPNFVATKLPGFGRSPDGSWGPLTGVAATTDKSTAQRGLSAHSYVTAIAWDTERGTEGSTKTILLGTSRGELYEYALSINNLQNPSPPTFLHKLGDTPVTGLYWERQRTTNSLWIIAATSGRHAPTRLTTFVGSTTFTATLATPAVTRELPGSVPTATLAVTQDHLALRTATGLLTARMDRSAVSATSVLVDVGLLQVGSSNEPSSSSSSTTIVSMAVTPHHWIVWNGDGEVCFWNRVSQTMVQKEIMETASSEEPQTQQGGASSLLCELLMDVRRPDQVWLRKGRTLWHISSSQEDRDVWKFTLQKCLAAPDDEKSQEALFESARTLCSVASQKVRCILNYSHIR